MSPEPLLAAIQRNPQLWNQHAPRREQYAHSGISDIWVRYNDWANFNGDLGAFNEPHESVWYPAYEALRPELDEVLEHAMDRSGARVVGGVLITRIPPGRKVLPHRDLGWHATHYDKYTFQIQGTPEQAFCFEGAQLSAEPGELYTFDNSYTHWVYNMSDQDRMTLIICLRAL